MVLVSLIVSRFDSFTSGSSLIGWLIVKEREKKCCNLLWRPFDIICSRGLGTEHFTFEGEFALKMSLSP